MGKTCLIVMRKDSLFNRALGKILLAANPDLNIVTSSARDINSLIHEVDDLKASLVIMGQSTPLASDSQLGSLLMGNADLRVIVVSEETNWLHVINKRDLLMTRQADLIGVLQSDC